VPHFKLDSYAEMFVPPGDIDLRSVDEEGRDWEVLKEAQQTHLERVKY
jgi:hypothetical protein